MMSWRGWSSNSFSVSSFLVSLRHPPSFFLKPLSFFALYFLFLFICPSSFSFFCVEPTVSPPFLSPFLQTPPIFLFFPQIPQEAPLVCVCMKVCVLMSLELSLPQGEVPRWGDQHCWSCRYQPQTPAWLSTTAHKCATLMPTHEHTGAFHFLLLTCTLTHCRRKTIPFLCFTCANVNIE